MRFDRVKILRKDKMWGKFVKIIQRSRLGGRGDDKARTPRFE